MNANRSLFGSRRALGYAAGALAVAVGGYLLFGASDSERVLALLREVLGSVSALPHDTERARARRLRRALDEHASPSVSLNVPELGTVQGTDAIVGLLALAEGVSLKLAVEQSDVRVDSKRAQATLLVSIVASTLGEERRQVRTLTADLVRRDKAFVLVSLALSAASREQPEARP